MTSRQIRREYRRFSPEEEAEHARIREQVERDHPPGEASPTTDPALPVTLGDYFDLRELVAELRDSRQARGLSLADVQESSGIDSAQLNRIETGEDLNPTINTLARYARAVGHELRIALVERESIAADAAAR
jgi:ribosome-binding protein aMBF1 (putative translation factor)